VKNTVFAALMIAATMAMAADIRGDGAKKPLVLADQGSFFVGGETKHYTAPPGGGPLV